jgi:hypothetical protein
LRPLPQRNILSRLRDRLQDLAANPEELRGGPAGDAPRVLGTDTHPNHRPVEGRPRFEVVSVSDLFADQVGRLVG